MKLPVPKESGQDFAPAPAGAHRAVCVRFIDLGTQDVQNFTTGGIDKVHKIMIGWELSDEYMSDGRPFLVQKRYTFSMHERANLRKDLETWRGKPYTMDELQKGVRTENLLGQPALVTVQHAASKDGSRTYANVAAVSGLPRGMERPRAVNDLVYLSLDRAEFKQAEFDNLSDNLRTTIAKSPEFQMLRTPEFPAARSYAQAGGYSPQAAQQNRVAAQKYTALNDSLVRERQPGEDDGEVMTKPVSEQDPFDDEIPF